MLDTGFPQADVENHFLRARRRQVLATLAHRLRREPPDSDRIVPLDEVVGAHRVGDLHFVNDGHHRVSIAAESGQHTIDAYVTEVLTACRPGRKAP